MMLACCVAPSPWPLMPVSALIVRPVKLFFRITLTTPAMASEPYTADAPSLSTSMRSMASMGIDEMSTKSRSPSSGIGYEAMRWPSISTSVAPTVRPRNATPLPPAANALGADCDSEPMLLAVMLCSTSPTLV